MGLVCLRLELDLLLDTLIVELIVVRLALHLHGLAL